jgi:hypothetical protein
MLPVAIVGHVPDTAGITGAAPVVWTPLLLPEPELPLLLPPTPLDPLPEPLELDPNGFEPDEEPDEPPELSKPPLLPLLLPVDESSDIEPPLEPEKPDDPPLVEPTKGPPPPFVELLPQPATRPKPTNPRTTRIAQPPLKHARGPARTPDPCGAVKRANRWCAMKETRIKSSIYRHRKVALPGSVDFRLRCRQRLPGRGI